MIETERLLLVPFKLDYITAAIKGNYFLVKTLGFTIDDNWPNPDYKEIFPFLEEDFINDPSLASWSRLVINKQDNRLIGDIGCKGRPDSKGVAEIGYSIVPTYRNQGIATEAVKALVTWLENAAEVKQVTAECLVENVASANVLKKAGFSKTHSTQEMIYWKR
ncbi:GNAT family N-acetyltransferase [Aquibacillus kalidii]|uniref:GNAT family N-acetyltransferase n=1 Tax=Aquibacillus kalidii TaxID=2762597 RepID=UPI0016469C1F|nr:GNAT family N-acetyltransferase [Aquibacillus kalidii]